jgi:hypothetical protein
VLLALSSVCQMPWGIELFIISSQDWGKCIIVVKQCMPFESGPEWLEELFSAEYYLALIQCTAEKIKTCFFYLLRSTSDDKNG